jgi:hypothetical protein
MLYSFIRSAIKYLRTYVFIILWSCFAFTGCTTHVQMYPGEALEAGKQAIIRSDNETGDHIGIFKVDNKITTLSPIRAREVSVLPGKHTIFVLVEYPFSHASGSLWLVAEPGGRYIVKESSDWRRVTMWIEDEKTGKKVGGITGSDDEPQ